MQCFGWKGDQELDMSCLVRSTKGNWGPTASLAASRVNQVTLARGVEKTSLASIRVYSHLDVLRTIIRAKSLDELTAVYTLPRSSPYRSLTFWNKFGSMPTE